VRGNGHDIPIHAPLLPSRYRAPLILDSSSVCRSLPIPPTSLGCLLLTPEPCHPDGRSHGVCCTDIRLPGSQRFYNKLEDLIFRASRGKMTHSWYLRPARLASQLRRVGWLFSI